MSGIDEKASAFARQHGSFALLFDAGDDYGTDPCPLPWSVMLDRDQDRGWGGHTAESALDSAASELAGQA